MSNRLLASNGVKVILLAIFLLVDSNTVKALCAAGLVVSLVIDVVLYRRDQRALGGDAADAGDHVPLPPRREPPERH